MTTGRINQVAFASHGVPTWAVGFPSLMQSERTAGAGPRQSVRLAFAKAAAFRQACHLGDAICVREDHTFSPSTEPQAPPYKGRSARIPDAVSVGTSRR